MGELVWSKQCPQSLHNMCLILEKKLSKDKKKNKEISKPSTLAYTMNLFYTLLIWSGPLGFPSKICQGQIHNLICHGLGPSSIGLGTNLKLLTNRNARFHWTLLLGPLSKVVLTCICRCKRSLLQEPSTHPYTSWSMYVHVCDNFDS
jgi:hypothetical protein